MTDNTQPVPQDTSLVLSENAEMLLKARKHVRNRDNPDEFTKLTVSRAVSFVALVYEKVRNAIEYREDHLIRRAAIERILRRRLSMNPQGDGEAENVLRELLWARYFPKNSLGEDDVEVIQRIINNYVSLRDQILKRRQDDTREYLYSFIMDLASCEIEEALSPDVSTREAIHTNFIYQTIHKTVRVEEMPEEQKDLYLMAAIERTYRKSDQSYQRYHIFTLFYDPISQMDTGALQDVIGRFMEIAKKIDSARTNKVVDKLAKFVKKQLPPYLILFEMINDDLKNVDSYLTDKKALWERVEKKCTQKYSQVKSRLTSLSIRSLIYIFATKMVLAIILEYPVSMLLYNEAPLMPIIINSLFPPLLLLMIVLWFRLPGKDNTINIYHRIIHILDADQSFESRVNLITKKPRRFNPFLKTIFTGFYICTFVVTFSIINYILSLLDFHLLSKLLFVFFISVVSFFAYRIKQIVAEYRLVERDSILNPVIDFFFLPILSLGKIFNSGVAKINVFIVIFDFIIEAPFKLIIDVIEEWISFVRARKDEIV